MQEIIKKLKFKNSAVVINAPSYMSESFLGLGYTDKFDKAKSASTLIFIDDSKALTQFLKSGLKKIEFDSILWLAYPKGTSKIKSDINRDSIRETCEEFGITTVTAISIDETWSALRFRPIEQVGK